jgi:predicted metal-dependent hydrolase
VAHDLDAIVAWYRTKWPWLPPVAVSWVKPEVTDPVNFDAKGDWGSYVRRGRERYVGISPDLKRAPLYVVRYLVGHELLHDQIPSRGKQHHPRTFQVAERLLPDYSKAEAWLSSHA